MDLVDQCHKVWQCHSMEIELAQASAKLVEQQAEIKTLRARINHLEAQLAESSWQAEHDRYYYESQPKETW